MMASWKELQSHHFEGCPLVAVGWDVEQQVEVRFHLLPGAWHYVGITDGSRALVVPAEHNPFGVDCHAACHAWLTKREVFRAPKRIKIRKELM